MCARAGGRILRLVLLRRPRETSNRGAEQLLAKVWKKPEKTAGGGGAGSNRENTTKKKKEFAPFSRSVTAEWCLCFFFVCWFLPDVCVRCMSAFNVTMCGMANCVGKTI